MKKGTYKIMALNIKRLHKFIDLVCELSAMKIILKIADASGVGSSDTCGQEGEGGSKIG